MVTTPVQKHDITSTNIAIATHSRNGQLALARKVFDEMPQRTVVSRNTIVSAYSKRGKHKEALNLLSSMHFTNIKLNETSFCSGLSVCARLPSFYAGNQLHCLVLKCGFESYHLVGSGLLYFYANCCEIGLARRVFDVLHQESQLLWSLMLVSYVRCNMLDDALNLFDKMPVRDIVAWTVIISGFSKTDGGLEKALEFFCLMRRKGEVGPSEFTLDCVIRVCGRLTALLEGMTAHGLVIKYGFEFEHSVSDALVEFYCACKAVDKAESVFDSVVHKDPSTYNLMIKTYSLVNRFADSVELFIKMPQKVLTSFNTMI
ncbi:pentatricopeptide repeat-containing protein At4g20770-like [Bidens hawaiensis]|uniref:pentatricopeptide repeat-containing protein At4g20770-like n=1 Tax=Bidens hawaiensis TaxID=980011 RepID=UPI0040499256